MSASTKYLLALIRKPRLSILTLSIVFVITFMYKLAFYEHYKYKVSSNNITILELCLVTSHVQIIRERQNTIGLNPARHVVEELLEIMTFNKVCHSENKDDRFVLVTVSSGRENFRERQLIRKTWGSLRNYKEWQVRTVYLMGQNDYCLNLNATAKREKILEEQTLMDEHRKYGDLVIGSFADTYRNLTYKHLMGYKFAQENCPQANFIIKTDDDMFVDIPAILEMRTEELLRSEKGNQTINPSTKPYDVYCHPYNDEPTRCKDCKNGKWFSTRKEWPEDTYPAYCLGNDYAISMEWLKKIYSVRGIGGFFWVDDVFIMGKLRAIAENTYKEKTRMKSIWHRVTDERGSGLIMEYCEYKGVVKFGLFVFLMRESEEFEMEMECLWRKSLQGTTNASSNALLVYSIDSQRYN